MGNFQSIKEALEYIDSHLDEEISFSMLAERFHFSPYYFHRMFTLIVGKTIACHVRDRRLLRACARLAGTRDAVLTIGLDCGYNSAQSFTRAFRAVCGMTPSQYRREGIRPQESSVDEMIMKFTNRLKGGIDVNPTIIKRNALTIAGVCGDGSKTGEVWLAFEKLLSQKPLQGAPDQNGYEVRVYDGETCTVYVGFAVEEEKAEEPYTVFKLPASKYASFDVYVANGYDSENNAMTQWLEENPEGYKERLLGDAHYCVEYYDERFHGSEAGSIVEIWIPIEKST